MSSLSSTAARLKNDYLPLIKSRQTFLLALTGVAGFLSSKLPLGGWQALIGLAGSLTVTISGCAVMNMVLDRDLDGKMRRTRERPLAAGLVNVRTASLLGGLLLAAGLGWALALSTAYFVLVLAGALIDLLVYTLWLKRRTAWSILWGGISGGIPILAGRQLAMGRVDAAGLLLALSIVCWIPSHNLTLGILYAEDYLQAGLPIFPNVFGPNATFAAIALSSLLTALLTPAAFVALQISGLAITLLVLSNFALVGLAILAWRRPSRQAVAALYKYSSLYMLAVMLLLAWVD